MVPKKNRNDRQVMNTDAELGKAIVAPSFYRVHQQCFVG